MKQLMVLVLGLMLILSGCQQQSDEKEPQIDKENTKEMKDEHKETEQATGHNNAKKPSVKVRVKSPETENDPATEAVSDEQYDTAIYNAARNCLLTGTCTKYTDTPEYSRAWNNLATEGYLCQDHHCVKTEQPTAEIRTVPRTTESVTTEQVTSEVPTTEVPATEQPSVEKTAEETAEETSIQSAEDVKASSAEAMDVSS